MINLKTRRTVRLLGTFILFFVMLWGTFELLPQGAGRNLALIVLMLSALFLTVVSIRLLTGWRALLIWITVYTLSFGVLVVNVRRFGQSINFLSVLSDVDNIFSVATDLSLICLLVTFSLVLVQREDDTKLYIFVISVSGVALLTTIASNFVVYRDPPIWRYQNILVFGYLLLIVMLLSSVTALITELVALLLREFQA